MFYFSFLIHLFCLVGRIDNLISISCSEKSMHLAQVAIIFYTYAHRANTLLIISVFLIFLGTILFAFSGIQIWNEICVLTALLRQIVTGHLIKFKGLS